MVYCDVIFMESPLVFAPWLPELKVTLYVCSMVSGASGIHSRQSLCRTLGVKIWLNVIQILMYLARYIIQTRLNHARLNLGVNTRFTQTLVRYQLKFHD